MSTENLNEDMIMKSDILADKEEKNLSKKDIDDIRKGVRPDGMDFEEFKVMRKYLNKLTKDYLKGQYVFISQTKENKKLGNRGLTFKKEKENENL